MVNNEIGVEEFVFDLDPDPWIKVSYLNEIVVIQYLTRNTQLLGNESNGRNPAAFSIAAVLHLNQRLKEILPLYWHGASDSYYTASPLSFRLLNHFSCDRELESRPNYRPDNVSQFDPMHTTCT